MKPKTTIAVVQILFLIIGLALLLGATLWWVHQRRFVATASHAQGTVVELERHRSNSSSSGSSTTWAPVVQFSTPDGESHTFVSSSSSSPPSYSRGERVEVFYQDGNPEGAVINGWFSLWGGISIFGALGLVFTVMSGVIVWVSRRGSMRRGLMKTGRRVDAKFQAVQENSGFSVNGRSPYQILCQWQDPQTSKLHLFLSENLWYDPSEFVHEKTFPVYLQPGNADHYYMDISALPELA